MIKAYRQIEEHTRTLILKEEEKAEKFINYWRLGLSFFFFLITYLISGEIPEKSIYSLTIGATIYLIFSLFMLFYLRAGKYVPAIKYLNAAMDVLLLTWVIWNFGTYRTFKNQAFLLYFMWIALGSMRFSFHLTVFAGALCVMCYSGLLAAGLYFHTFEIGTITESYTTHKVSLLKELVKIIYLALVTIALSFGSKSYVRMANNARNLEMDAERQRMKAQRLESVGFLAGGIAHDFNNALAVITNNLHVARVLNKDDEKTLKRLEAAESAAMKATNLTRQLLTFSKGGAPMMRTMRIRGVVEEAAGLALTGKSMDHSIRFGTDEPWPVKIDEGQIGQVLNNLLINAVQASALGSHISITVENHEVSGDSALPLPAGDYVRVSVEDNGEGIPDEIRHKVFDPYFSTKEKGSGLGLATAYSIMKQHNGFIEAESSPGKGATLRFYLPASDEHYHPDAEKDTLPDVTGLKILIMDDEQAFLSSAGEALMMWGHEVAFASNGKEAIELYNRFMAADSPFDVVIMDLMVPGGMGGVEAMEHLVKIDPGVKAIVCSGYSNDPVMANPSAYGFKGILSKPFTVERLKEELALLGAK